MAEARPSETQSADPKCSSRKTHSLGKFSYPTFRKKIRPVRRSSSDSDKDDTLPPHPNTETYTDLLTEPSKSGRASQDGSMDGPKAKTQEKQGYDSFNPKAITDDIAQFLLHARNKEKKDKSRRSSSSKKSGHKKNKEGSKCHILRRDKGETEDVSHIHRIPPTDDLHPKRHSGSFEVRPFPTNLCSNCLKIIKWDHSEKANPQFTSRKSESEKVTNAAAFGRINLSGAQRIVSLAEHKNDQTDSPPETLLSNIPYDDHDLSKREGYEELHQSSRTCQATETSPGRVHFSGTGEQIISLAETQEVPKREPPGYSNLPLYKRFPFLADCEGRTFLHQAALKGNHEFLQHLIQNGAKINARTLSKRTPLHEAAEMGHLTIAKTLLRHGAKVNVHDKWQCTPLHKAVVRYRENMARLLLNSGAHASGGNLIQCAILCNMDDIVELLIERGADVNDADITGQTPLHCAAKYGKTNIVRLLINNRANVNKVSRGIMDRDYGLVLEKAQRQLASLHLEKVFQDGVSPLRVAQEYLRSDLVVTLVDHGANVTICDSKGQFPHHKAVLQDDCLSLHRILIHPHCPIDIRDFAGFSALQLSLKAMEKCYKGFHGSVQNGDAEGLSNSAVLSESGEDYIDTTVLLLQHGADYFHLDTFLAAYLSDNYLRIFQALVHSGENLHKKLLCACFDRLKNYGCTTTCDWLSEFTGEPQPLKDLCRHTIRLRLKTLNRGRSVWQAVQHLPLPKVLQDFLLLQEFQTFDLPRTFTTALPTWRFPKESTKKSHRHHHHQERSTSKC